MGTASKENDNSNIETASKTNIGHQIYKHLMNGVSHMLPFVVSGGVLIAISFLWGIFSSDTSSVEYNEIAATLNSVGGFAMSMMVPVLSAYIAAKHDLRPGLEIGLVGGLIASARGTGFSGRGLFQVFSVVL